MTESLNSTHSLFDFFLDNVQNAHDAARVELTTDTVLYLASLLTERARTDTPQLPESTLAELHGRAAHARPADRVRTYRELGDRALYRAGFFSESLRSRMVNENYYSEMGAAAYYQVDQTVKRWFADAFGPVFRELAYQFRECVLLLTRVRDKHDLKNPDAIMRLYQQWQISGNPDLAAELQHRGLVLSPNPKCTN